MINLGSKSSIWAVGEGTCTPSAQEGADAVADSVADESVIRMSKGTIAHPKSPKSSKDRALVTQSCV